jgi:hypothetical protein
MNDASPTRKRRLWRPQFSLRVLLIALSLFAIGFPIWYRWPYQDVLEERDPTTGAVTLRRISDWQRQWGGERLLHGKSEVHHLWGGGEIVITTHYVHGNRQGPYTIRDSKGRNSTTGQYLDNKREGVWTYNQGDRTAISNYRDDELDGTLHIKPSPGTRQTDAVAVFDAGKLISFNGQPVHDRRFEILKSGAIDERSATELQRDTDVDFVETPLRDVVEYLKDKHNIPIVLDGKQIPEGDLPITAWYRGIDLAPTLTLVLAPHGLAWDYRYGCVWITTAEDAKNWHDPTGVADIKLPTDSVLGRAWNERVYTSGVAIQPAPFPPRAFTPRKVGLEQLLVVYEQRLGIEIDISPDVAEVTTEFVPVASNEPGITFHDILGQLLYFTGCRCKLKGDKLMILPPDE